MKEKINTSQQFINNNKKNKTNRKNTFSGNNILSKAEMDLYDEVEQKFIELKKIKNDTRNIKKSTIKEFVYSSRRIPNLWKHKKNYKNIVLETFVEDNNFLKYLGNADESDTIQVKSKTQIRPKTASERKSITNLKLNNKRNIKSKLDIKELDLNFLKNNSNISNYNSLTKNNKYFKKPKIKLRKIISQQEEIQMMLDGLKEKYPLRNKLIELYSNNDLKDINFFKEEKKIENSKTLSNINSVENLIDKSRLHKIQKIERNIFNNLLSSNKNNLENKYKDILDVINNRENNNNIINKSNYYKNNIMVKNEKIKNEINDSIIFNQLKSTNFYGPYFSYCPYCGNNNIKYYKQMERKQCISLLNYIKKDRNKKMEIEESKFREKVKLDKKSL